MTLTDRIQHTQINTQPNIGFRHHNGKWQVIEYQPPQYNKKHWTKNNAGRRRSTKVLKEFTTRTDAEDYAERIRQQHKAH